MRFAFLYVPTSGNQGDLTAAEKETIGTEVRREVDRLHVVIKRTRTSLDDGARKTNIQIWSN